MTFPIEPIKYDCRHYTGYKPCHKNPTCAECTHYSPQGARILIIKFAAMGDVLRTLSILPGLQKKYQNVHITWVTLEPSVGLIKSHPLIDRLLINSVEALEICQAEAFDLCLNFEKETEACALAMLANAKQKKGFSLSPYGTLAAFDKDSHYALQLGLDDELKFHGNQKSYPEIIYEMAGIKYSGEQYELTASNETPFTKKQDEIFIGINTGCGTVFATKKWTEESFTNLIKQLIVVPNITPVLLGGPLEKEFNKKLAENFGDSIINTGCENSIPEFINIVNQCDIIVSSDSLAMHIAIALKKRVVALIGPTSASEIDVFNCGEKIVTDFSCSPCYLKTCDKNPTCMQDLKAETVAAVIENQLEQLRNTL